MDQIKVNKAHELLNIGVRSVTVTALSISDASGEGLPQKFRKIRTVPRSPPLDTFLFIKRHR